jgi:hypothetical protein
MRQHSASISLAAMGEARLEGLYGNCDKRAQAWIDIRRYLETMGIDAEIEAEIRRKRSGYFFGVDKVRGMRGGRFDFDEGGGWSLILPELQDGEIVDLIAVTTSQPRTLTTLRGAAAFLGEEALERDRLLDDQLLLYDNPLLWLRDACEGGVVVSLDPLPSLLEGPRLIAHSLPLAERLVKALTRPRPKPRIMVQVDEAAA